MRRQAEIESGGELQMDSRTRTIQGDNYAERYLPDVLRLLQLLSFGGGMSTRSSAGMLSPTRWVG